MLTPESQQIVVLRRNALPGHHTRLANRTHQAVTRLFIIYEGCALIQCVCYMGPVLVNLEKGVAPLLCQCCICVVLVFILNLYHICICIQGVLENLEEGVAPVLFWLPHYYIRRCFLLHPVEYDEGENWRQRE